jgi:hypothetical protein
MIVQDDAEVLDVQEMYIHVISRDFMVTCPVWQNEDKEKKDPQLQRLVKAKEKITSEKRSMLELNSQTIKTT